MTLQDSVQDCELPQSVNELRVLRGSIRRADRDIESSENLFERVVVAFTVPAWKICVSTRRGFE